MFWVVFNSVLLRGEGGSRTTSVIFHIALMFLAKEPSFNLTDKVYCKISSISGIVGRQEEINLDSVYCITL